MNDDFQNNKAMYVIWLHCNCPGNHTQSQLQTYGSDDIAPGSLDPKLETL